MAGTPKDSLPATPEAFAESLLSSYNTGRRKLIRARLGYGFGTPIALLLIWELVARAGLLDSLYFPAPSEVFGELYLTLSTPERAWEMGGALGTTLKNTAIGFGVGSGAGILLGVLMGAWRLVFFAFGPMIYGTYPMPKVTLFPLAIVIFGLGALNVQAIAGLSTFYIVCIATIDGVRSSPVVYSEMAATFRLARWKRFFRVIIPAALPAIVNGLRLGSGVSLVMVLIIEFIGSNTGMGAYIWNSFMSADVGRMFVALVVIGLIGGLLFVIGERAERWAAPWNSR